MYNGKMDAHPTESWLGRKIAPMMQLLAMESAR
jgi:hypothetical protein